MLLILTRGVSPIRCSTFGRIFGRHFLKRNKMVVWYCRDVIRSRPLAKNACLLTWAGPATFSITFTVTVKKIKNYPLNCVIHSKCPKNISFGCHKIIASLVEKKHCFPSLVEKNIA
jgi:hypothetical protein